MKTRSLFLVLFGSALLCSIRCSRNSSIELGLDFSGRSSWHYRIGATVDAQVTVGGRSDHRSLLLSGVLSAVPASENSGAISVVVADVGLEGNLISESERNHVIKMLSAESLSIDFVKGTVIIPESAAILGSVSTGWDFYRLVAKGLPSLPAGKVRSGFTWERERHVPLPTRYGMAIGHSYFRGTLDSVRNEHQDTLAYLSWESSLTIDADDSANAVLDSIPGQGKGKGYAIIDVGRRSLRSLRLSFQIAPAESQGLAVTWKESLSLEMVP